MTALLSLALALGVALLLEGLVHFRWRVAWAQREIFGWTSPVAVPLRLATTMVGSILIALYWELPWASGSVAAALWIGLLASETDLRSRKIPREPCWAALAVGFAAGFAAYSVAAVASFVGAFALLGFILLLLAVVGRGRSLGSGDVRLVLAMTPVALWIGAMPMLWALLFASLLQILVRIALALARRGGKFMPFGPSLFLGVVITLVLSHPAASNPCAEWLQMLSCG